MIRKVILSCAFQNKKIHWTEKFIKILISW
jgi:hypothetical protein